MEDSNGCPSVVEKGNNILHSQSLFEDLEDDTNSYIVERTELDRYLSFRLPERSPNGE